MIKKLLCLCVMVCVVSGCMKTSESFQADADIVRLQHLKYYGELVEEYAQKNGLYPFQGEGDIPVYVHVANTQQKKYVQGTIPYEHTVASMQQFVARLEEGLGRTIDEKYDPQYVPSYKPNFYIYMIYKDTFFFAVHLHHAFPFAKKVGEHYYKLEISNLPTPQNRAARLSDLLMDESFAREIEKAPVKAGFFTEREALHLHDSKS